MLRYSVFSISFHQGTFSKRGDRWDQKYCQPEQTLASHCQELVNYNLATNLTDSSIAKTETKMVDIK